MKLSKQAEAIGRLRIATETIAEARAAWRRAGKTATGLREALRSCTLAARCARTAATLWARDARLARALTDEAARLDAAIVTLKFRLAAAYRRAGAAE